MEATAEQVPVRETRTKIESVTRKVVLQGTYDIMFDRYPGDNDTKLEPYQKLYYRPGTKELVLPATNFMSFLSAHNTNSAPKRLRDKRKYKDIANACQSFVQIAPPLIPFLDGDGAQVVFGKFELDKVSGTLVDPYSRVFVTDMVARLDKGIPNPKIRPVLPLPWSLAFDLTITENTEIQEQEIQNLVEEGGRAIGLGTYRGVYGKFTIEAWD